MMWWIIGYVTGAVGMMLFVAWTALDYPLPRTKRSIIDVTLAILFWPVATVVILVGFVYTVADAILFEERTDSGSAGDAQTTATARECTQCGARLPTVARHCRRCGRPVPPTQP